MTTILIIWTVSSLIMYVAFLIKESLYGDITISDGIFLFFFNWLYLLLAYIFVQVLKAVRRLKR